jgi:hypothetical protein
MSDAKSEPTPTPWAYEANGKRGAWIGKDGDWAALSCGSSDDKALANARLIVRAVNAHDALLEALQLVVGSLAFDREDATNREVLRRVRAAINLAEGL